jgi:DNA-binding IclR family transcriptional regulator
MSQTLDRALRILPLLAEGPAGLEQVATRLDVHKSTALRLLRTLHEHGLVYRQHDQRYRLGAALFALAQQAVEALDIREIAHPHLAALNERIGHTVHLAVYEQGEVVYIDKVDSRYPVRMYSRVGRPVAITVAAVAKVLLADLPEPERRAVAERLDYPRYTARSTPDAAAFLAELARVREQGWAADLGGHEESINCVGAPLRGPDGRVRAAMSVSAPNVVVAAGELLRLRPLVLRTAEAISAELSGTTPGPGPGHGPGPASASASASASGPGPAPAPVTASEDAPR